MRQLQPGDRFPMGNSVFPDYNVYKIQFNSSEVDVYLAGGTGSFQGIAVPKGTPINEVDTNEGYKYFHQCVKIVKG